MDHKKFIGTGVAIVTPFRNDGSIDFKSLGKLLEHVIKGGVNYIVAMMELRLAKHLSRFGICFIQLGEVIDYHGQRALFYIDDHILIENFKPELEEFYQFVDSQLKL